MELSRSLRLFPYFEKNSQVLDDKNVRRRFRASNYQSTTRVKPFICTMPMRLDDGWNQIQFNLSDFTRRAYGTNYIETLRVQVGRNRWTRTINVPSAAPPVIFLPFSPQIHANCRIRRVYFSDRLYSEDELPAEFKLYLPVQNQKAKVEAAPNLPVWPSFTLRLTLFSCLFLAAVERQAELLSCWKPASIKPFLSPVCISTDKISAPVANALDLEIAYVKMEEATCVYSHFKRRFFLSELSKSWAEINMLNLGFASFWPKELELQVNVVKRMKWNAWRFFLKCNSWWNIVFSYL